MSLKVLILGINGFIGSSLTDYILQHKEWEVYGMDLGQDKLGDAVKHPRLHFTEGDITIHQEWVEYHIKKCDVVIPLVAIANPAVYVQDPLRVFELDFEANLPIIRWCVKYHKRIIFPSTSEVYGISPDKEFDEYTSPLMLGPVAKQRWIYSCSKQLLDRVICGHGMRDGLRYTLFRPFNWMGPRLDNILANKEGGARAFSQFIGSVIRGKDISLVNGGEQRRCFVYIDDAIDALARIIENKDNCAENRIFNIGNPKNDISMRELAETIIDQVKTYPKYRAQAEQTRLIAVAGDAYFGEGYDDVQIRIPAIKQAQQHLGWQPTTDIVVAIRKTLDYYLLEA